MERVTKQLFGTLMCLVLLVATVVGCNNKPDSGKDLLAKVYKKMAKVSSFSMHSKLLMDTTMSGVTSLVSVDNELGVVLEPFELTMKQEYKDGEKESVTNYMYTKPDKKMETFLYNNGQWNKTEISSKQIQDFKEKYSSPVDFCLYFNEVDSFTITSSDDEAIVLEGTVSESNMVNVLKETGALKQLSLTSFPEDKLGNSKPIIIKAWVDPSSMCFTKVSVDMTQTYQDLTNLLFGEDSLVSPKINQCMVELSNIVINKPQDITMPADIQASLDKLLQG